MDRNGLFDSTAWLVFIATLSEHCGVSAQVDLTGMWRPLARNEDGSGMDGDYAGLPLNAAGRARAQSWAPENFEVPEWVCRPHAWDFSLEAGASQLRIDGEYRRPHAEADRACTAASRCASRKRHLDGRPDAPA